MMLHILGLTDKPGVDALPQDPGTTPARRLWASVDVGTEIYVSNKDEIAEWTLSDFDVLVPVPDYSDS